jgi:tetratricopeptide (TPR) repeat protein
MHHYCWALISANRAKRGGIAPQERRYLYQSAINDSFFVIENSQPDFVLLPEIYFRMGQYYSAMGDASRAMEMLQKSREIKADYWPAYLELAAINLALGRRQAAIDFLETGLQNSPGQAQLAAELQRIKASAAPRRAASAAKR